MKTKKTFRIILTVVCFLTFGVSVLANVPPVPEIFGNSKNSADCQRNNIRVKKNADSLIVMSAQKALLQAADCPNGFYKTNGKCIPLKSTETNLYKSGLDNKFQIYIGGGLSSPGKTAKNAGAVNGTDINIGIYKPVWYWNNSNISLGINAGGSYTTGNGDYALDKRFTVYNLKGQSQLPTVSEKGSGSPKQQNFKIEAGPQMNIKLGNITLSPIFNLGYLSMSQKSFVVSEKLYINSLEYDYDLLTQKSTKTSGLGFIPKIRIAYNIKPNLGIWIESCYILGPKTETESTRFVLDPNIPGDSYNLGHFQEGQYITSNTQTKYNGLGLNAGIVIGLGKTNIKKDNQEPSHQATVNEQNKQKKCREYYAPTITSPTKNDVVNLENDIWLEYKRSNALFVKYNVKIWKDDKKQELIYDKTFPNTFSGRITGLDKIIKGRQQIILQMQAIPATVSEYSDLKGEKAAYQKTSCTTFENNGWSNKIAATLDANSCLPNYEYEIVKAECVENGKIKITGNYTISQKPGQIINNVRLDSLKIMVDGNQINATNILNPSSSINNLPINNITTGIHSFSFELNGEDYCDKNMLMALKFHSNITVNGQMCQNDYQCFANYDNLPCCICNYCDEKAGNIIIKTLNDTDGIISNGNVNIQQQFNITPKIITNVKAEIISMEENEVNEDCKKCRKNADGTSAENDVYKFLVNNTLQWGNGALMNAISGNLANTFPSKILNWSTNSFGNLTFNLSLALPGVSSLSCCERHGKICIRYSFTDLDCKTCSTVVCYNY